MGVMWRMRRWKEMGGDGGRWREIGGCGEGEGGGVALSVGGFGLGWDFGYYGISFLFWKFFEIFS